MDKSRVCFYCKSLTNSNPCEKCGKYVKIPNYVYFILNVICVGLVSYMVGIGESKPILLLIVWFTFGTSILFWKINEVANKNIKWILICLITSAPILFVGLTITLIEQIRGKK